MAKCKGDLVSVKIIPNEQDRPPGKRADAEVSPADLVVVSGNAIKATAEQWSVVQHVQKALPDATVTLRAHRLAWKRQPEAPTLTLFGVLATQRVGPFTLRREYDGNR